MSECLIAAEWGNLPQHVGADDAVFVVGRNNAAVVEPDHAAIRAVEEPTAPEQEAPEALRRDAESVASGYSSAWVTVPDSSITASQEWASTTSGCSSSASTQQLQEIAPVEVVGRRPLEQLAA